MNNNSYWGNGYMGPYHPPYHHNMHEVPPYDPYYPYYAPDPLQDSF